MPRPAHCPRSAITLTVIAATLLQPLTAQSPGPRRGQQLLAQLPARLVPNVGQWASPERYRVQVGGLSVFLEDRGWSFWLRQPAPTATPAGAQPPHGQQEVAPARALAVRMTFDDSGAPRLVPEQPLGGATNFLLGDERDRHRRSVPGFAAVRYESVYPGVDVRVRSGGGCFEYDLLLAPGADLEQVRLRVEGAERLALAADGSLTIVTALGDVHQPLPRTWVVGVDGRQRAVPCHYELRGAAGFGFVAPTRALDEPLIVDPPILYSTIYGGTDYEYVYCITEDGAGRILVGGNTLSQAYPTTPGVIQTTHGGPVGGYDGFLLLLDPSQPPATQLVFATLLGGGGNERVASAAFLQSGLIAIAGDTLSTTLPTTPGVYQPSVNGGRDGYVGTITTDGATIVALTYVGGGADDFIFSLQPTPGGNLLVCGRTLSTNYPVTGNAWQGLYIGGPNGNDCHVTILDMACTSVVYATYLGGTGDEWIECSGVDGNGLATFHGASSSTDFPTTATAFRSAPLGGLAGQYWGSTEAVVLQLDPGLPPAQQLVYSSYLGGSSQDWCERSAALAGGRILVAGTTASWNFPTTAGSYQPTAPGGGTVNTNIVAGDAFVAVLDRAQGGNTGMVWGTYFGGAMPDQGLDCVVDATGEVTVVGWTQNIGAVFPTTPDALLRSYRLNEGWVARLSGDGRQLLYASLLGGSNHDGAWLVTRHADGQPTITGATVSADYPVVNANGTYAGAYDTFVTRMGLNPINTARYGVCSGFAGRYPTIHALGDAVPGNTAFGFACSRAPSNGAGLLVVTTQPANAVPFFGISLNVDVNAVAGTVLVFANANGEQVLPLVYPPVLLTGFYAQYLWLENPTLLTLSASDSLQL